MATLHVFAATPKDVAAERDSLALIVQDLNECFAQYGLRLELLDWRNVMPSMGRPEDVILDQLRVDKWDIFVGVLWARFGTPPGRKHPETGHPFLSGTEEEFSLAHRSWRETGKPRILFYRCTRPVPVDKLEPEQLKLVQELFAEFKANGEHPGLFQEYETVREFERRVQQDLLKLLLKYSRGEKQAALERQVGEQFRKLQDENEVWEGTREGAKIAAEGPLLAEIQGDQPPHLSQPEVVASAEIRERVKPLDLKSGKWKGIRKQIGPVGLLSQIALGLLLVMFFFKVGGWNAGIAALIVLLALAIARGPAEFRRLLTVQCLVFVVALISGSIIQSRLASDAVQRLAERNSIIRFFVGGLAEQIVVSTVLGLLLGLLVVTIPLLSVMLVSSEFVLALHEAFGVNRVTALRYLLGLIMGTQYPWQIVEDGRVVQTKPAGILDTIGGPGLVVIGLGNAVVFERGGQITKIEGPGLVTTRLYERIRKVIDLRPQWYHLRLERVLTRDLIPLAFDLKVGFQVEPKAHTDQRGAIDPTIPAAIGEITGVHPVYKETVYRAVYRLDPATPARAVKEALNDLLRGEVRKYDLDDLHDYFVSGAGKGKGSLIAAIEAVVEPSLDNVLREWGLKLLGVDVSTVEMPDDIKTKVLEWWARARQE